MHREYQRRLAEELEKSDRESEAVENLRRLTSVEPMFTDVWLEGSSSVAHRAPRRVNLPRSVDVAAAEAAHLTQVAMDVAATTALAPVEAIRRIRTWWINRSAVRRARYEAHGLVTANRGLRRTPAEYVEQSDVSDALGCVTEVRDARRRREFGRGERADEIAYSLLNKFGPLKATDLNRKLIRGEIYKHDLFNHATLRESHKYALMQDVLTRFFVVRDSDMVEHFTVTDKRNVRRAAYLASQN